ncbi:Gfo/Idh/MocA family protein [Poriferisphaera sp. WC338]|uniref:Gfo/Idh/MocA family protein n=1 Tax=Poriferisphaera sp. WC338 TaxID=3425129 RepID=UPI003D819F50
MNKQHTQPLGSTSSTADQRLTHAEAVPPDHGGLAHLPEIDLRQLLALSDDTGIFQHALYSAPDPNHGYCIDDNARALIAAVLHAKLRGYDERIVPLQRYLTFLAYAYNEDTRAFRNFMGYDRHWLEDVGSTDSQGRTIWALGLTISQAPNQIIRELAEQIFFKSIHAVRNFTFIRSRGFSLHGLQAYLDYNPHHKEIQELRDQFAEDLYQAYKQHATDDWPWWEDTVTYDNAKLSHALLICGQAMKRQDMIDAGLASLHWLLKVQTAPDGHLSIIGNEGWLQKGKTKASFAQQPLEAYAMVDACLTAAIITKDQSWAGHAWTCFHWFTGQNDLGIPLYHAETGGCQDGLETQGPNKNQGAESSLAYLLSVLELHLYYEQQVSRITATGPTTLGLGIVGASKFADFATQQYQDVETINPIAIWNRSPDKAKQFASKHNLQTAHNLQALLENPAIQLIYIASTPATHAELATAALNHGKHVLCEKPIAISQADAHNMIHTAYQRDLILGVNHALRFGPLTAPIQQLIGQSILGMPIRGFYVNRACDAGYPIDHWFWNHNISGGIFVEHGVNAFDLMRSWFGEAQVLAATRFRRQFPGHHDESNHIDQSTCDLRYGYHTTINYYHGFNQPAPLDEQDFRIIFEHGQIIMRGWIANSIELRAMLTHDQLAQLKQLFPNAEYTILQTYDRADGAFDFHGRSASFDQLIVMRYDVGHDKQTLYANAIKSLITDVTSAVQNRKHKLRVSMDDALAALNTALEADRLARGITP